MKPTVKEYVETLVLLFCDYKRMGESEFARLLGVNLLAANQIAMAYMDGKDWWGLWLEFSGEGW